MTECMVHFVSFHYIVYVVVHYGCENVDDIYIDVLIKLNTQELMPWKVDKTCKERILNGQKKASSKNGNWWPHKPYFGTDDKGKHIYISIWYMYEYMHE